MSLGNKRLSKGAPASCVSNQEESHHALILHPEQRILSEILIITERPYHHATRVPLNSQLVTANWILPHSLMCFSISFPPVRYLLKNNVSPDLCNEDGLTALHQVRMPNSVMSLSTFGLSYCFDYFSETVALMASYLKLKIINYVKYIDRGLAACQA